MIHCANLLKCLLIVLCGILGTVCAFGQTVSSVTLSPSTVTASCSTTGTVTMSFAPSSNMTIDLSASTNQVTVPSTVTIPAGSTSATFTITTTDQGGNYSVSIYAVRPQNSSAKAILTVSEDTVASVSLSPSTVTGGAATTGTVTLATAATGSFVVDLSSSISQITVPGTVTVAAGSTTGTFTATTSNTGTNYTGSVYATTEHSSAKGVLTVVDDTIASVTLSPSTITGGCTTTGTITLNTTATGNVTVNLSASLSQITVPATATVAAGSKTGTFTVSAANTGSNYSASIYATNPGTSAKAVITVVDDPIVSLSLSPSTVTAGTTSTGTVTLTSAPTTSFTVNLSAATNQVTVPATMTVAAGSTTGTFTVQTQNVGGDYTVSLYATNPHSSAKAVLTVVEYAISSLSLSPTTVTSGGTTTGTVTLSSAPTGNLTVNLSTSIGFISVPTTVTVAGGSTTATFTVSTEMSGIGYSGKVYAANTDTSAYAVLTVTPLNQWFTSFGNFQRTGLGLGSGAAGTLAWSKSPNGNGLSPVVITAGHNLVTFDSKGNILELNSSGSTVWTYATGDTLINPDGTVSSPTLDANGNVIAVGKSGYVYSVSPTGTLNWKTNTSATLQGSAAIDAGGNIIVCSSITGTGTGLLSPPVISLSPGGVVNWTYNVQTSNVYSAELLPPTIDLQGNILVCSSGPLVSISPSGKLNWTFNPPGPSQWAGPVAIDPSGNIIAVADASEEGTILSISPTGSQNWQKTFDGDEFTGQAVIDANGNIIDYGEFSNSVHSISSSGATNWSYVTRFSSLTPLALDALGNVIVTDQAGNLDSISSSGHLNWTYVINDGGYFNNPAVIDSSGRIYFSDNKGNLLVIH